ncbi:MAG: hypothetical protein ACI4IE_08765 [Eubacterium sp.]
MRNFEKILACFIAAGIAVSPCTFASAAEKTGEKEEVIYANLTCSGEVKDVYAVNIFGSGRIVDYGDYSNVKLLNSSSKITQKGDKITFNTNKERVYCQGDMKSTELPWTIKISYKLNGEEIIPENLAGESGKLEIHLIIEENEDCDSSFYDDYALQASLALNTEKCKNITADDATQANAGKIKQLSYTILPGKGIDTKITANVTDFEMDSISINGISLSMDIEVDDKELKDEIGKLTDACKEVDDGAGELKDGAKELADNGAQLNDGSKALTGGAQSLSSGLEKYSEGVSQMQSGIYELNSQSDNLTDGSAQMQTALLQVQNALNNVKGAEDEVTQLLKASADIQQGINEIAENTKNLEQGVNYDAYKNEMSKNGLDIDELKSKNSQTISSLTQQIKEINAQIAQLESAGGDPQTVAQLKAQADQLEQIIILLNANNGAVGGTQQYLDTVNKNIKALAGATQALSDSYAEFNKGLNSLSEALTQMMYNTSMLSQAVNAIVQEYSKLDSGINEYTDGVAKIALGCTQISESTKQLVTGSKEINTGASELYSGVNQYTQGSVSLYNGTVDLKKGTSKFYSEASGADKKIDDKIEDMIDSISGGDSETQSFVSDKNTNVKSLQFVIKTDPIEEEEKEENDDSGQQKQTFWDKILALFKK